VLSGLRASPFRFSRDGARLFGVRRGAERRWELTIWDVARGVETRVVVLPLAPSAELQWLTLSPDDSRLIVSAGTNTSDIWLLEEFEPPASRWARWLGR
jgi:dipeptidyl aminopeptidase/acylaminoacyl peptidase